MESQKFKFLRCSLLNLKDDFILTSIFLRVYFLNFELYLSVPPLSRGFSPPCSTLVLCKSGTLLVTDSESCSE